MRHYAANFLTEEGRNAGEFGDQKVEMLGTEDRKVALKALVFS